MTDRYLVALDLLTTHGGSRVAAWRVAGELLESADGSVADVFELVATADAEERMTAATREVAFG